MEWEWIIDWGLSSVRSIVEWLGRSNRRFEERHVDRGAVRIIFHICRSAWVNGDGGMFDRESKVGN